MKVFGRILLKFILLLLVIVIGAGGAIGWRTYQRSTAEYIMDQYLSLLISGDDDKAYELLDQSEDVQMTAAEYASALEGKRYSLNSSYTVNELEKRVDTNGNEYVDFHAEFKDASDTVQIEEDFVVKKQSEAAFGVFDQWRVLSGHCMVKDLQITVPTGAEVYLDSEPADSSWIVRDEVPYAHDCYRIPSLLPGKMNLVIRHPALESVNTTFDTTGGDQDYSAQMPLKQVAKDECKELGVKALQQLYAAAVKEKSDGFEELFGACLEQAEQFVKEQGSKFHQENSTFQNAAISDFAPQFGEVSYVTEGTDGAITTEMTFSYHYAVREDVTTDTEDVQEDGTPVQQTERISNTGDNTAALVMSFSDGTWSIASMDVPVIG